MRPSSPLIKAAGIAFVALLMAAAALIAFRNYDIGRVATPGDLVEDDAALMTAEQRAFVDEYHRYLLTDFNLDYRVVTTRVSGDINQYAVERFAALAKGGRSGTGRLLLLVVDPKQDIVRLEVGYALEGVFPDAFVAYVEHRQMVPFFRDGRVADGIVATTELIVDRAQKAAAGFGFDNDSSIAASGGAGATAKANLGAGSKPVRRRNVTPTVAGTTPEATLAAYFVAMQAHDDRPALEIYTEETRDMLRHWTMTRAQMDNVVRTYRDCQAQSVRIGPERRYAVIRYAIKDRACAPWFFQRDGSKWHLDLTMMQRAIRFGRRNAWRFDMNAEHAYGFAFVDWTFDSNGFPQSRY